jgi:hypothetical protein
MHLSPFALAAQLAQSAPQAASTVQAVQVPPEQ